MNIEKMAAQVAAHPDYRVLRRYVQPQEYKPDDGSKKDTGLFVDTETTGLDHRNDRIIELGMVAFSYSRKTGAIYRILDMFAQLEDPGIPIPANIVAMTGISDDMVRGKRIDDAAVADRLKRSTLIIAHNADFDRKFMEKRLPIFAEKPWACSIADVFWEEEGIPSKSLHYLAFHYGFFFEGHRSTNDCLAGLHILAQRLPVSERLVMRALLENARRKTHRVWAIGSPIEKKDLLKARGYHWNPGDDGRPRAWFKDFDETVSLDDELRYLTSVIKCPVEKLRIDDLDAFTRYSGRE